MRREEQTIRILMIGVLFSGAVLWSNHGAVDGALAIALPPSIAAGGFSYGYSNNLPDASQAAAEALKQCQITKDAIGNAKLRALCKVIQNFSNQYVAVAMDPGAGTPGVGWGGAANTAAAQSLAIANCKKTAGPERQAACRIDNTGCDGSAK